LEQRAPLAWFNWVWSHNNILPEVEQFKRAAQHVSLLCSAQ